MNRNTLRQLSSVECDRVSGGITHPFPVGPGPVAPEPPVPPIVIVGPIAKPISGPIPTPNPPKGIGQFPIH